MLDAPGQPFQIVATSPGSAHATTPLTTLMIELSDQRGWSPQQANERIVEVITPEQREKFEQMRRRRGRGMERFFLGR